MRILVIDNYPGTRLGLVGDALNEAGARVDLRTMYRGDPLPEDPHGHDGLVVLGGGQSAVADDEHPYLSHVAGLTRAFGEAVSRILGVLRAGIPGWLMLEANTPAHRQAPTTSSSVSQTFRFT